MQHLQFTAEQAQSKLSSYHPDNLHINIDYNNIDNENDENENENEDEE